MRELAVELGVGRESISKQLKMFDIPIRNAGSNQNRKLGLAYGMKVQEIVNSNLSLEFLLEISFSRKGLK